jgi:curli biogenesis system outer membrane secretion channel CsgG
MLNLRIVTVAAALSVAAAALVSTPAASAKGGDGVKVRGTCTQGSSSKLKLSRDDSGNEIEFEVDQNQNGVPWKVTLLRGGSQLASATVTTHAPSGSFEYRKRTSSAGTIKAIATRTGERCTATATI